MNKNDLSPTSLTFTSGEVERLKRFDNVTRSGVVFHDELASSAGASFVLIREAHTTTAMLQSAVHQLRGDRDVVGPIRVAEIEPDVARPEGAPSTAGCYTIRVAIDIPAFAEITVSDATSLVDALQRAEVLAHALEPDGFVPQPDEWTARLRIVNVRNDDSGNEIENPTIAGRLLQCEWTDAEKLAYEALAAILEDPANILICDKQWAAANQALDALKAAKVDVTTKDWQSILTEQST